MHFTNLLTSALLGVAAAASGPQAEAEDAIKIVDFYAIKKSVDATAGGAVTMVSFQINPAFGGSSVPIPCAATVAEGENELRFDSASYSCKTSLNKADQYSFKIGSPDSRGVFDITVSHKDGSKLGAQGRVSVPTSCQTGSADSVVCSQDGDVTVKMSN